MQQKKVKYHPRESQRIKQKLGKMGRGGRRTTEQKHGQEEKHRARSHREAES